MKIKKITIKNLNSLKGTWVIDLEDPAFLENKNQFVICGETGSGKTTILDAISLACFGKTPRSEEIMTKLTNSEALNELMTRRTTTSEATVIYECRNGTFESSFKMRKAGGKADGNMKYEFTLVNLETGEPICDTITNLRRIEEVTQQNTNLSYLQFTRSMILAQGKFDKFIGAREEERAQIMEAISGTDYAAMGVRIAAKAKSEIKKYSDKKEAIDNIAILSEEEEAFYVNEKNGKPQEIENVRKLAEKNSEFLKWLELFGKFEKDLFEAEDQRSKYEARKKEFKADEKKLADAEKTFSCNVPYTKWKGLTEAQESDEKILSKNEKDLEIITKEFSDLKEESQKKAVALKEKKSEEKKKSLEWKKARELFLKIDSQKEKLSDSENRKNISEGKLIEAKKKEKELRDAIAELKTNIEKAKKYLGEHENDKSLESYLLVLQEKGNAIKTEMEALGKLKEKIKSAEKEIEKITVEVSDLLKEKEEANAELKDLVTSKYKIVSEILRASISDGKACPVCGSESHPFACENHKGEGNKESSDTAEKIRELSDKIEKLEKGISEKISLKDGNAKSLEEKKETFKEVSCKIESSVSEFNKSLEPWKLQVAFEKKGSFEKIYSELEELSGAYKNVKENFTEDEKALDLTQKELDGIKTEDLEKDFSEAVVEYENNQKDLEVLFGELKTVSGGKYEISDDVDADENQFKDEKEKLEAELKDAEERSIEVGNEKTSLEGSSKTLKEQIEKRSAELDLFKKELDESLEANGFASVERFEACRVEDQEFKRLKAAQEELKKADTGTSTRVKTARDSLSSHKKIKPKGMRDGDTEKLSEEYVQEKTELEKKLTELSERLGEVSAILKENDEKKNETAKLREELKAMEGERNKWQKILDMIGKLDGTKFQVFVQVLFFKNLIKKANKYFTGILPEYSLVQVPGKVDFRIHSNSFSEDKEDRECGNMSGGEKFIISLSFALGISELSSRSVSIDSLFLDEGFGTLSGNALLQSVAALKKLQTAGKTLGIITHVSEVIKEFDLKIEAKQTRGVSGYSELQGPGITRLD